MQCLTDTANKNKHWSEALPSPSWVIVYRHTSRKSARMFQRQTTKLHWHRVRPRAFPAKQRSGKKRWKRFRSFFFFLVLNKKKKRQINTTLWVWQYPTHCTKLPLLLPLTTQTVRVVRPCPIVMTMLVLVEGSTIAGTSTNAAVSFFLSPPQPVPTTRRGFHGNQK